MEKSGRAIFHSCLFSRVEGRKRKTTTPVKGGGGSRRTTGVRAHEFYFLTSPTPCAGIVLSKAKRKRPVWGCISLTVSQHKKKDETKKTSRRRVKEKAFNAAAMKRWVNANKSRRKRRRGGETGPQRLLSLRVVVRGEEGEGGGEEGGGEDGE